MPELLTPGVFVEEKDFGPQPIEGVSTSTAGFVGETQRGPHEGTPTLVTSFADFQRKFGGFESNKDLAYAIHGFFDNGGRRAFISRIVGTGPAAASAQQTEGYDVALLEAAAEVAAATQFSLRVASVVGAQAGETVEIAETNGSATVVATIDAVNSVAGTLTLTSVNAVPATTPKTHFVRYYNNLGAPTNRIALAARDVGKFGNKVSARVTPIYLSSAGYLGLASGVASSDLTVASVLPFTVGHTVEIEDESAPTERAYATVTTVDEAANTITVDTSLPNHTAQGMLRPVGWRLDVFFAGQLVETIDQISSDNAAADGIETKVNEESTWVRVTGVNSAFGIEAVTTADANPAFPLFAGGAPVALTGGGDGAAVSTVEVIGSSALPRTGLRALEAQQGINIIGAPGYSDKSGVNGKLVSAELIGQAERLMDRFAVLETDDDGDVNAVLAQRGFFNSRFGAMYHPWVEVLDPVTGKLATRPPAGHVMGAYARTDNERGVFKAPANVVLRGVGGFSHAIVDGEQDLLNPAGVNALRTFTGLGPVIWGARTVSAEGLWRYVPVRRLFIFLSQSIVRGTRFAVFEPNDHRLWARLRDAVINFLTTQWRAGALFGARPEEAFFVRVDETTTTQDDRDNGRVNIIVGVAPVKPAEFIVFQIGQAPQSVIISEQA